MSREARGALLQLLMDRHAGRHYAMPRDILRRGELAEHDRPMTVADTGSTTSMTRTWPVMRAIASWSVTHG